MAATIKEDTLEALIPLFEEGLKPKKVSERLAKTPGGLQLAPATISTYATEWRKRTGKGKPVPEAFLKEKPAPAPEKHTGDPGTSLDQEVLDQFQEFCTKFPDQCRTAIAEGFSNLGNQLGPALKELVTEAIPVSSPPPAEDTEVPGAHIEAGDEPTEKDMMLIPPATYIQWLRGHIETCPTCLGMGEQLTVPLQGILAALTPEPKPEAEDERHSEDGAERGGDPGAGNPEGSPGQDRSGGRGGGGEGTAEEVPSEEAGGDKATGAQEDGRPDGERPTVTDPVSSESGEPATAEPTAEPTPEPTPEPTEWRWGRGRG